MNKKLEKIMQQGSAASVLIPSLFSQIEGNVSAEEANALTPAVFGGGAPHRNSIFATNIPKNWKYTGRCYFDKSLYITQELESKVEAGILVPDEQAGVVLKRIFFIPQGTPVIMQNLNYDASSSESADINLPSFNTYIYTQNASDNTPYRPNVKLDMFPINYQNLLKVITKDGGMTAKELVADNAYVITNYGFQKVSPEATGTISKGKVYASIPPELAEKIGKTIPEKGNVEFPRQWYISLQRTDSLGEDCFENPGNVHTLFIVDNYTTLEKSNGETISGGNAKFNKFAITL